MKSQRLAVGLIRHIGSRGLAMQLALLRSGAGVTLVGLLSGTTGWSVMKTDQLPLQLLRGFVSALYLWVLMYSFAHMPFADATAISYAQAAYIVAFSALTLNERVTTFRWIATAIGIVGALLIIKPTFLDRNVVYLAVLLGASLNGLAFVLNKYLQRSGGDSELTTMFYVSAITVVCNLTVLATMTLPQPDVWPWLSDVVTDLEPCAPEPWVSAQQ